MIYKLYKPKSKGFNFWIPLGVALMITSFIIGLHFAPIFSSRHSNGLIKAGIFIGIVILFWTGMIFLFFNGTGFAHNGHRDLFVETALGDLFHVFVLPPNKTVKTGYTLIGKISSTKKNMQIIEENSQLEDLLKSSDLPAYLEEYIAGHTPKNSDFWGKVHVLPMENVQIIKKNRDGILVWYTVGRNKKIHEVLITKNHDDYKRLYTLIKNAPKWITYNGLAPGDFID